MDRYIRVSFGRWAYKKFAPEIEMYVEILLERIVPIFYDVEGEQKRRADEVLGWPGWELDDYGTAIETAYEAGIEKVLTFVELRPVFLATGVSGLFHLFERQLLKHLNHELRGRLGKEVTNWRDARSVLETLKPKSVYQQPFDNTEIQNALDDPDLRELQLVANAVKHGPGHSYDQLQDMEAAVVDEVRLKDDGTAGPLSILGVSVVILPEDVERYRDCLLHFWQVEGNFVAPLSAFGK